MSRYSKNLAGQNLKVFVSPAVAYTTDATFAEFIANSPEGEIGVYLSSGALQSTSLASGDEFFIAQKRNGTVNKTPVIKWDEVYASRLTEYDAPVRQISTIGYGPSSLTSTIGFNFTGASLTNAQTYGISVRETTPGNQPFPIQEGYVTVTSATADQYTQLATIVGQLNMNNDFERTQPDRFVKAEILSNGTPTYLTSTIDPTLVNGSRIITYSANVTVAAGAFIIARGAIYKVTTGVTAGTSLTIDRPYEGASETIDVSVETTAFGNAVTYTSGTTLLGVRLTGLQDECHFKVAGNTGLQSDTITLVTSWKLGAGSYASIRSLEEEGIIYDGIGSTVNAAFASDYGYPTIFATSGITYDQFFIDVAPKVLPSAALPIYEQKQIQRIVIAVPSTGTSPTADLEAILGL